MPPPLFATIQPHSFVLPPGGLAGAEGIWSARYREAMQNPTLGGVNLLEHLNAHVSETKNLGFGYVHVYVHVT
jgi:hypothetical protein